MGRAQWPSHDFIANWDYSLPFGKGKRWLSEQNSFGTKLLGFFGDDWSLTEVLNWRSGHFFSPTYSGFDPGNINKFSGRADVVRIPAKANASPKGSRTVFRAEAEHGRSVATLAF